MPALLTVRQLNTHIELLVYVLGQVLRGIYRTVLTTSTSETDHQVGEIALFVTLNTFVYHSIYMNKPLIDGTLLLKEADDIVVKTGERLILVVLARVVKRRQSKTYPPPFPEGS